MNVLVLAHLTFLEARQRRLFWIILVIGLAALGLFTTGFYFMYRDLEASGSSSVRMQLSNVLLMMALYGVSSLGVMLAVLISADTISGEIASGTIQTVVTKPLRRWEIVLGKWLGLAAMLAVFTVAVSAGFVAIVWRIAGYLPPHLGEGLALMVLEGVFFLTLSILGGTRLPPMGNGVAVFMLYGLAFVGGWVEQAGALLHIEPAVNIGIIASLLVPGETMWRRAAYLMQPPVMRELNLSPFTAATAPSTAMVIYTVVFTALALGAAVYSFGKRDL